MARARLTDADLRVIADAVGHAVDDLAATIQDEPNVYPSVDACAARVQEWEDVRLKLLRIINQRGLRT